MLTNDQLDGNDQKLKKMSYNEKFMIFGIKEKETCPVQASLSFFAALLLEILSELRQTEIAHLNHPFLIGRSQHTTHYLKEGSEEFVP